MIIAIDGPSGAGKSSVSIKVAERLGFSCLDTGAMFRSIAWLAQHKGVDVANESELARLANENSIEFRHENNNPRPVGITIAGIDVTKDIRSEEIDRAVGPVSAVPAVRAALLVQQQRIGCSGNYVVEGRDIGTTVFPDAELKVFLTASDEARAKRRVLQNKERGLGSTDFDTVLADIIERDNIDSTRSVSPLQKAKDAIEIDSSHLSFNEVLDSICTLARERMK